MRGLISTIPSVQTVPNAVHSLQYPRCIQMECAKCEIIKLLRQLKFVSHNEISVTLEVAQISNCLNKTILKM